MKAFILPMRSTREDEVFILHLRLPLNLTTTVDRFSAFMQNVKIKDGVGNV